MSIIELKLGVSLPPHVFDIIENQLQVFHAELLSGKPSMVKDDHGVAQIPNMMTFVPKVETVNGTMFVSVVVSFGDDKYELELVVPEDQMNSEAPGPGADMQGGDVELTDQDDEVALSICSSTEVADDESHTSDNDVSGNASVVTDDGDVKREMSPHVGAVLTTIREAVEKSTWRNKRTSDENLTGKRKRVKVKSENICKSEQKKISDNETAMKMKMFEVKSEDDAAVSDNESDNGTPHDSYSNHSNDTVEYKQVDGDVSEGMVQINPKKVVSKEKSKKVKTNTKRTKKSNTTIQKQVRKPRSEVGHERFKCDHCKSQPFRTPDALEKHIARHNFGTLPNADGVFVCEHCKKQFKTRANLTTHLWIHKEKRFQCSECDKKFVQKIQLKVHSRHAHSHSRPYLCVYCGKSFTQQSGLAYHLGTHEAEVLREKLAGELKIGLTQRVASENTTKKVLCCIICDVQFSNVTRWLYHLQEHLTSDTNLEGDVKTTIEGILRENENFMKTHPVYRCTTCNHVSFNSADKTLHKAVHVEEKTIQCPQCDQMFSRDSNLKHHFRRIHRRLKCELCDARFGTNKELLDHQEQFHGLDPKTAQISYDCDVCPYKTKQKFRLLFHLTKVHGVKNMYAEGKRFNFTCPVCEKTFATKYGMQLHQRIHTNERPFVCHVCSRSYSDPSNLIHHGRRVHPDIPKKEFLTKKSQLA